MQTEQPTILNDFGKALKNRFKTPFIYCRPFQGSSSVVVLYVTCDDVSFRYCLHLCMY